MAKKIKWNSERILSLTAMSMSFITLIIFIYQTNLMSRQNYLSILPYLALTTSDNSGESTFSLDIGMAIPANQSSNVFKVNNSKKDYQLLKTNVGRLLAEGLNFEIVYKSIQNERWRITIDTQGPEKMD